MGKSTRRRELYRNEAYPSSRGRDLGPISTSGKEHAQPRGYDSFKMKLIRSENGTMSSFDHDK